MKTIRLKVKQEAYSWLNSAAIEVNRQWNWCNEYTLSRVSNGLCAPSGYDLNYASAGFTVGCAKITADTINVVNQQYALKRRLAKARKLRWRVSSGPRRSLGWVPFKGSTLSRKSKAIRYAGKAFRVFELDRLDGAQWKSGCFSQDAAGDWWLCLPVDVPAVESVAPQDAVGVDLGLKQTAVTSDGERLESGHYRRFEPRIAQAQRRGHKRHAKRLHRKAARCRADAMHKFSTALVQKYQRIFVGDVSSSKLVKTRMAKSTLDASWYALKTQLEYKCQQAAREFQVIDERYTTRACSSCGCLSGPSGLRQLVVRAWICGDCGASHDRDINAARNILVRAKALASVSGNEAQP